ncbi:hypothetical protein PAECIP111893_02668 [Paenibacillus plantiphilus]|uniref:Uncharacterized protein n=1 Tax=Paenibacillus plantiphilus TaxID=2905650 RepID=A0ABN8GI83_9BACL|nr:hypothetical protein [Paenibacillus plantiphilus]CAH1206997.1 hypothetical protein PAECIP111893_02668 [Paenibacillus plantiphilus]
MPPNHQPQFMQERINKILHPDYPLCRDDVVWMLEYIKKKVADEAPELLSLPQPRLLRNFQSFAEASMILIKQRSGCSHEADRLRACLSEAMSGLRPLTD